MMCDSNTKILVIGFKSEDLILYCKVFKCLWCKSLSLSLSLESIHCLVLVDPDLVIIIVPFLLEGSVLVLVASVLVSITCLQ